MNKSTNTGTGFLIRFFYFLLESTSVSVWGTLFTCLVVASWSILDITAPRLLRVSLVSLTGVAASITKKRLEQDQTAELTQAMSESKHELIEQATVTHNHLVGLTDPDAVKPTVFASRAEDSSGLSQAIQTILAANKTETTYGGLTQAIRFTRVKLIHNIGSQLQTNFANYSTKLHLGLVNLELDSPPLVSVVKGFLCVDIPKNYFDPISWTQFENTPQYSNYTGILHTERLVGFSIDNKPISYPVDNQHAFTMVGGRTQSGKTNWGRSAAIRLLTTDPNAFLYLIDFKAGAYSHLQGCDRIYRNSIAYDEDQAALYCQAFYQECQNRIAQAQSLTGIEYQEWFQPLNPIHLFFEEYQDSENYTAFLEFVFRKGAAYKMGATLLTQKLNLSGKKGSVTVSGILRSQAQVKIAFAVEDRHNSDQILGESGAEYLLGQGDGLIKLPSKPGIERFQSVLFTDQECFDLVKSLNFVGVKKPPAPPATPASLVNPKPLVPAIKAENIYSKALKFIENSPNPVSLTSVAVGITESRSAKQIGEWLDNEVVPSGLLIKLPSKNGKGFLYKKP